MAEDTVQNGSESEGGSDLSVPGGVIETERANPRPRGVRGARPIGLESQKEFSGFENAPSDDQEDMVQVTLLNTDVVNGKYAVVDQKGKAYLIPVEDAQYTVKAQSVKKSVLDNAEEPYQFDDELPDLMLSKADIRKLLWKFGIVTEAQAKNTNLRSTLLQNRVLVRKDS